VQLVASAEPVVGGRMTRMTERDRIHECKTRMVSARGLWFLGGLATDMRWAASSTRAARGGF
jgi:hypothetical protein